VLPYFAVEATMVGPDGIVLVEPHRSSYASFLASQISSLLAFFEARDARTRGEVTVNDDEDTFQPPPTPPNLGWHTPSSTNRGSSGQKSTDESGPRSGVFRFTFRSCALKFN
jgi:hypothetical protein